MIPTNINHHHYYKSSEPTHAEGIRLLALNIVSGMREKNDAAWVVRNAAIVESYILGETPPVSA